MIDFFNLSADKELFVAINSWNSDWADSLMWFISGKLSWIWLYLLLLYISFRKVGLKAFLILIPVLALLIFIADAGSVHLFKNVFMRPRPSHNPDLQKFIHLVNGYRGGQYGFISSHASNVAAIALFFILLLKTKWLSILLITSALLIGYSRIYLGVHYPTDVVVGYLWGAVAAIITYFIFKSWKVGKVGRVG